MPSKSCSADCASRAADPATGCVEGARSAAYPHALRAIVESTHASVPNSVAASSVRCDMYSANDSLSHRSSHHCIVTRSPNHMCAISWAMVLERARISSRAAAPRKTYTSRKVTQPGFSIAPALNSGTNTWWYSPNGYLMPKSWW